MESFYRSNPPRYSFLQLNNNAKKGGCGCSTHSSGINNPQNNFSGSVKPSIMDASRKGALGINPIKHPGMGRFKPPIIYNPMDIVNACNIFKGQWICNGMDYAYSIAQYQCPNGGSYKMSINSASHTDNLVEYVDLPTSEGIYEQPFYAFLSTEQFFGTVGTDGFYHRSLDQIPRGLQSAMQSYYQSSDFSVYGVALINNTEGVQNAFTGQTLDHIQFPTVIGIAKSPGKYYLYPTVGPITGTPFPPEQFPIAGINIYNEHLHLFNMHHGTHYENLECTGWYVYDIPEVPSDAAYTHNYS